MIRVWGFSGGLISKETTCNAGDQGSIPGSRRSPGKSRGNPLQCSCLEKSMDRGACWVSPWGHKGLDRNERLTIYDT